MEVNKVLLESLFCLCIFICIFFCLIKTFMDLVAGSTDRAAAREAESRLSEFSSEQNQDSVVLCCNKFSIV